MMHNVMFSGKIDMKPRLGCRGRPGMVLGGRDVDWKRRVMERHESQISED